MTVQVADVAEQPGQLLESSRTLARAAANSLREAILLGRLKPGTKLSQDQLARQLGVSRVPLREALQLLTAEGLVEWRAHRTALVTGLSADDLAEMYELGAVTEAAAAKEATRYASDEHIEAVGALVKAMADPSIAPSEWHVVNRRFHAMLIEPARWPRFQRIISEVRANTGRYVKAYLEQSGNIHHWRAEHREIYLAYRNLDADGIATAIYHHWRNTSDTLQKHLRRSATAADTRADQPAARSKPHQATRKILRG
ncbi:MAG: GntR family transcriptional regulator [Hyphomicrobiales bacterium]|nr:GntR family transcriptional regulator [Hyphomicrobiales bacterium]